MLKVDGNEDKLFVIVVLTTCSWAVCLWSCLCSKLAGPQDNTAGQSRNRNRPWKITKDGVSHCQSEFKGTGSRDIILKLYKNN